MRRQARRQAREAVDLLAHHPSLFVWCGHNEPMAVDIEPGARWPTPAGAAGSSAADGRRPRPCRRWNRTLLDRAVKTVLEHDDGTRPVIAHSGVLPHLPQLDGTDSHLYFGWYHGDERDLPDAARPLAPPRRASSREFGAQAVPEHDDVHRARSAGPTSTGTRLARRHALQKADVRPLRAARRRSPPTRSGRRATQAYQARVVRYHVETLRRLKYRPTGGFAQFCFADSSPGGRRWSVLDHERRAQGRLRRPRATPAAR